MSGGPTHLTANWSPLLAWGRIWILVGRIAPWDGVALGKPGKRRPLLATSTPPTCGIGEKRWETTPRAGAGCTARWWGAGCIAHVLRHASINEPGCTPGYASCIAVSMNAWSPSSSISIPPWLAHLGVAPVPEPFVGPPHSECSPPRSRSGFCLWTLSALS